MKTKNKKIHFANTKSKIPSGLKLGKMKSIPLRQTFSVNSNTDKEIKGIIIDNKCYYKIIKRKKKK